MKVPGGWICTEKEINGSFTAVEPDWTIYADCLDCSAFWRGEYGEDDAAVRFRVDEHIRQTSHRVRWTDAEHEFYDREPTVISEVAA